MELQTSMATHGAVVPSPGRDGAAIPLPKPVAESTLIRDAAAGDSTGGTGLKAQKEVVGKIVEGINAVLDKSGSHIRFVHHKGVQMMVVQVLDNKTDEVIRTIPDTELLDLAAKISDMVGVIVDHKT